MKKCFKNVDKNVWKNVKNVENINVKKINVEKMNNKKICIFLKLAQSVKWDSRNYFLESYATYTKDY